MAKIVQPDPQSASDYEDRTTKAVKGVLVEIGQILGSFKGKFAVIGGAVPWLLLNNEEMPHVGTLNVDLGLDGTARKITALHVLTHSTGLVTGVFRPAGKRVRAPTGGPPARSTPAKSWYGFASFIPAAATLGTRVTSNIRATSGGLD